MGPLMCLACGLLPGAREHLELGTYYSRAFPVVSVMDCCVTTTHLAAYDAFVITRLRCVLCAGPHRLHVEVSTRPAHTCAPGEGPTSRFILAAGRMRPPERLRAQRAFRLLCGHVFSVLLHKYLEVELWGSSDNSISDLLKNFQAMPHHCTILPTVWGGGSHRALTCF